MTVKGEFELHWISGVYMCAFHCKFMNYVHSTWWNTFRSTF